MRKKEENPNHQTAFEVAGIPTPKDAEDVTPTDMVSEAVEEIMDGDEHEDEEPKKRRG